METILHDVYHDIEFQNYQNMFVHFQPLATENISKRMYMKDGVPEIIEEKK